MAFIFLTNVTAQAPKGSPVYVDKITVENSEEIGFYYHHIFKAKETLYSLSKSFGSNPEEVYKFNPGLKGKVLNLGERVKIPIRDRFLVTDESKLTQGQGYIPVYYKVLPKETLYKISRHYFNQPLTDLMAKNKMQGTSLSPGQELLVGWISQNGKNVEAERYERADSVNLVRKNEIFAGESKEMHSIDGVVVNEIQDKIVEKVLVKTRGQAFWDMKSSDKTNLFVLHSKAKKNSFIELINPMLDRRVFAKVVGTLPPNIYPDDVNVLVSSKVASMLGAKDAKFLIEMKYLD